ncbi:MAG: 4Fe-4S dicluster domain-containing protein, partial [Chloroflexota bacterium]
MNSFNTGLDCETLICARCGYCQAVCPVYTTLGWESTGPRGRIAIARRAVQGAPLSTEHERRVY